MSLPQATWAEAPWISHILPQCPKRHLCCQESKIKDEKLRHFFLLVQITWKICTATKKKRQSRVKKTQTAKAVITPHLYKTLLISFFLSDAHQQGWWSLVAAVLSPDRSAASLWTLTKHRHNHLEKKKENHKNTSNTNSNKSPVRSCLHSKQTAATQSEPTELTGEDFTRGHFSHWQQSFDGCLRL